MGDTRPESLEVKEVEMHEAIEQRTPRRRAAAFGVLGVLALGVFLVLGEARSDALAVTEQSAEVENAGQATANSGGNVAVGNASSNSAANLQGAGAAAGGEDAVAVNAGGASNESDGTAIVATGDASATGVASSTEIVQVTGDGGGGALALTDQSAEVENTGAALAISGGNVAVGNASDNDAANLQLAGAGALGGDAVAANVGGAANVSDGTAVIVTGDATAVGVVADTEIAQIAGSGGGLSLTEQEAEVTNVGLAAANTGGNIAVGNASDNEALNAQGAFALGLGGDAVAVNFGGAANISDGTAIIVTGDATAVGVASWTDIAQLAGGGGLSLTDQDAEVANVGLAAANTGGNIAVGNTSDNDALNVQGAFALGLGGPAVAVTGPPSSSRATPPRSAWPPEPTSPSWPGSGDGAGAGRNSRQQQIAAHGPPCVRREINKGARARPDRGPEERSEPENRLCRMLASDPMTTNDGPTRSPNPGRRGNPGTWIERERSVRRYLSALEAARSGRDANRTADAVTRRIHKIDELMVSADPLTRLGLTQERVELHAERLRISNGRPTNLGELERDFVRSAKAYGERVGVTYAAWRQVGVDADVLERAKIGRPAKRTGPTPPEQAAPDGGATAVSDGAVEASVAPAASNGADASPAEVPAEPAERVPEPGPTKLERPAASADGDGQADPGVMNGERAAALAAWMAESGDVEPQVKP